MCLKKVGAVNNALRRYGSQWDEISEVLKTTDRLQRLGECYVKGGRRKYGIRQVSTVGDETL